MVIKGLIEQKVNAKVFSLNTQKNILLAASHNLEFQESSLEKFKIYCVSL